MPSNHSQASSIDEQREVLMDILHKHLDDPAPVPPRRSSHRKSETRSGGSRREKKGVSLFLGENLKGAEEC